MSAFCSTRRIGVPCWLISFTISKIFSTKIGASPIDGSSSSNSLGRAVRADQRDDLAVEDLERDPLQRVDRAVVGVHVLELEDLGRAGRVRHASTAAEPR